MSKPEEGAEQPSVPAKQAPAEERQLLPTPESIAEELKAEVQEYKDKYLRALAEIENSRKRLSREKVEAQSYAVQNIVVDLLQPIDHLEQALKHAEEAKGDITTWAKGFEMILEQLHHVLADHGVSSYVSVTNHSMLICMKLSRQLSGQTCPMGRWSLSFKKGIASEVAPFGPHGSKWRHVPKEIARSNAFIWHQKKSSVSI